MKAAKLLKCMRRDVAQARRMGVRLVEWQTHTSTGPVCVDTVTLSDLRFFAVVLAAR